MLVEKMIAPLFEANTYIFIPDNSDKALVVDPGHGHVDDIRQFLNAHNVSVGAVVCTHGHPDHVWDAAMIAGEKPVYIPNADMAWMDGIVDVHHPLMAMMNNSLPPFQRPDNVVGLGYEAASEGFEPLDGLAMKMVAAPGHSPGSSLFLFDEPITRGNVVERVTNFNHYALCGDVIFLGSIGRTDLPGSDEKEMMHSLRTLQNIINPATALLTGHGSTTSMEKEIKDNAFLAQARYQG